MEFVLLGSLGSFLCQHFVNAPLKIYNDWKLLGAELVAYQP